MTTTIHNRHIGDTLPRLRHTLKSNGDVVDLTGKAVTFSMYQQNGTAVVQGGSVTVIDPVGAVVEFHFDAAHVATPGTFNAYFVVSSAGETHHVPPQQGALLVVIHDHA